MNILYHLHHPPGGFVLTEIKELHRRDHSIAIFVMNEPDGGGEETVSGTDIPIYYATSSSISSVTSLISSKITKGMLKELDFNTNPKYHLWTLHQSLQCINFVENLDFEVELIHGHFATRAKLSAVLAANYFNIPCTVTAHAADIYKKSPNWLGIILNRMDSVITISEYNNKYISNNIDIQAPVNTIYLGVDIEKFRPLNKSRDPLKLVSVSRLVEKKGLKYTISAIDEMRNRYPELQYNIVGDGERREALESRVMDRGMDDSVKFLGRVSDKQLREEVGTASLFVLPCVRTGSGNRDGIPVALMEAMSMGTVPISTKISGIPELINHRTNGLLVEPRDVHDLKQAISHLLENPDIQDDMRQPARQTIKEDFNIEHQINELIDTFQYVIKSHPGTSRTTIPRR